MLKKKLALPMAVLVISVLLMGMAPAQAADGTSGSIDFDQTSVSEDTLVYIHFKDLDAASDYMVNTTVDATGYSFTTGASQDDIYIPILFEKPSGSNAFTIYLRAGTGTAIDQLTVYITEPDTVLNTAAFLAIVVPLLIFAIVVAIYKSVSKGSKK